ncbi:MAG: beta-ketoacyl synthase [Pseudomonadota bacterium]
MAQRLPVIAGFGGINAAGRLSFHHGYRRMVFDTLPDSARQRTLESLAALTGQRDALRSSNTADATRQALLDGTLIRGLEAPHSNLMPWHTDASERPGEAPVSFELSNRQVPDPLPPGWQASPVDERRVRITLPADATLFARASQPLKVSAAGQLPRGFDPGALYQSRNHPRALQITVFSASDALRSCGIPLTELKGRLSPDQVAVYSGSAMGQLDNEGYGGMYQNSLTGRRPTAKNVPLGLSEMPGDFINAYVLGFAGDTAGIIGACATFLYNLKRGAEAIATGSKRLVMIGNAEAPIVPEVMEGYRTMGALAEDEALAALDGAATADLRRACRPFSDNCGFTVAEAGSYVLLMDDELALETGARILGSVGGVFANADGFKKSIPGPGIGNYITMGKALGLARNLLGERGLQQGLHVQAHGTGTPQNRVTESDILSRLAGVFGIEDWPVTAIKAYVGHSMAPAGGDQLAAVLGTWEDGILPGITTIDHLADDVHREHLAFNLTHRELAPEQRQAALINSKGFGGNNATGLVLSAHATRALLERRWDRDRLLAHARAAEPVAAAARAYDDEMCEASVPCIYQFGEGVLDGPDLEIDDRTITVPGFGSAVDLDVPDPY